MSENIGVVDWFTKKQKNVKYPEESNILLDEIIAEIIDIFNTSSKMSGIADELYKLIERSPLLNDISSDSRFPICSLFHHLKNTSGIAVCLMLQKLDTDEKYGSKCLQEYGISAEYGQKDLISLVRIAALLHDIGKPRSYTSSSKFYQYHYHTTQSKEIIEHILSATRSPLVEKYELKKILPLLSSKHHQRDVETSLEKLLSTADTVASAADRINEIGYEYDGNVLRLTSNDKIFPHEINFDAGDLKCLNLPHTVILGNGQSESRNVELKDKSLKSARLFIDKISAGGPVYWLGKHSKLSGSIGILSLDVMGIQGFINEADKLKMLRGGSSIIDDVLRSAENIISKHVCKEAILFSGGGNLLSFVPNTKELREQLVKQIENETKDLSKGGLSAAIVHFEEHLSDIAGKFYKVLQDSQSKLDQKKNENREKQIIISTRKICEYCFKRPKFDSSGMCMVCKIKEEKGMNERGSISRKYVPHIYGLKEPTELNHIGDSIAVLLIDGNMMGRLFQQTTTPAEYTYKSQTFGSKFEEILRQTIFDFCHDQQKQTMIKYTADDGNTYLGIVPIYAGGDDALIIMNARGALDFAWSLINNIADEFVFEIQFHDNRDNGSFKNYVVTASCGIAIADSKFPVYFLLNAARDMESKAKKAFREGTDTNNFRIIKLPKGSIALTAISSAMPGRQYSSFVINDDLKEHGNENLEDLSNLVDYALNGNRSLVSDIITCSDSEEERLNLIKFMYSSLPRKTNDIGIDKCEWMAKVLLNDELLNAAKMIIPHIWSSKNEEAA
ncbi:HD domain-containing protein [Methanomethylovorans sp.]|uniref:Cas10/Cmr2 second palm domain-containing protein n=1 Tax=Methanomethylovorans sp. TaxID=2758717 RepID=UPI00345EFDED